MPRKKSDAEPNKENTRAKSKPSAERKVSKPRSRKATTSSDTLSTKGIVHEEIPHVTSEELRNRIAKRAYELYQQQGNQHGQDVDHWIEAETQVKEELKVIQG